MASLCVLFEDLRIEVAGIGANELTMLDECAANLRKFYFLRRSIATLYEFSQAIQELDKLPSFQRIKAGFDGLGKKHWNAAVEYFKKQHSYLARIRNHVGGHFGKQAASLAIRNLLPDATGSIEITFGAGGGGGAKLYFANEIAVTGALLHVEGKDANAKAKLLVRRALVGYRKAVRAVDCISAYHLWDRFGLG